jgi:hypothetical protein
MIIENQLAGKWDKFYIGKVKTSSFHGYACFLFCLTYLYSIKQGRQVSPAEVDKLFIKEGVYNGDLINSQRASEVLGLEYNGIEYDITKPPKYHPSIKQVDYSIQAGKQTHFVIREVKDGKNIILDPLGGVERNINFYEKKVNNTAWKDKMFSYRLFKI